MVLSFVCMILVVATKLLCWITRDYVVIRMYGRLYISQLLFMYIYSGYLSSAYVFRYGNIYHCCSYRTVETLLSDPLGGS